MNYTASYKVTNKKRKEKKDDALILKLPFHQTRGNLKISKWTRTSNALTSVAQFSVIMIHTKCQYEIKLAGFFYDKKKLSVKELFSPKASGLNTSADPAADLSRTSQDSGDENQFV